MLSPTMFPPFFAGSLFRCSPTFFALKHCMRALAWHRLASLHSWGARISLTAMLNDKQKWFIKFTAKIDVPRCAFCKIPKRFWHGFFCSVNHLSGAGLMQITMQRARPAWPAMTLDCSRIAKEITMVSGLLSREGVEHLIETLSITFTSNGRH